MVDKGTGVLRTNPVEDLFPGEIDPVLVPSFESAVGLLEEVLRRGTVVFARAGDPSIPAGDHTVPGSMCLRHMLDVIHGVLAMVREGVVDAAYPLLRVQLEIWLHLNYLTGTNSEERGYDYIVFELHRQIEMLDRLDSTSARGRETEALLKGDDLLRGHTMPDPDEVRRDIAEKYRRLNASTTAPYERRYQEARGRLRGRIQPYSIDPFISENRCVTSLDQLARFLGLWSQYEFQYRPWSDRIHSAALAGTYLTIQADRRAATPALGNPRNLADVTRTAAGMAVRSFELALRHYRPRALGRFRDWIRNGYLPRRDAFDCAWSQIEIAEPGEHVSSADR